MSSVHTSTGVLEPPSPHLRSEVAIVCDLAAALLGADHPVAWAAMRDENDRVRDHIARVIPGFADFNRRVHVPGGFVLPQPPRDERRFATPDGRAQLTATHVAARAAEPGFCCCRRCGPTTSTTRPSTGTTTATAGSPATAGS